MSNVSDDLNASFCKVCRSPQNLWEYSEKLCWNIPKSYVGISRVNWLIFWQGSWEFLIFILLLLGHSSWKPGRYILKAFVKCKNIFKEGQVINNLRVVQKSCMAIFPKSIWEFQEWTQWYSNKGFGNFLIFKFLLLS